MADFIAARPGQANGTGDTNALFLKLYAGEVLTTFDKANIFNSLHRMRTISNGKSAQFPNVGQVQASFHVPGSEIQGQNVQASETIITIDDLLIAPVFVANIDEAKNHYDVRSIYTEETGRVLAREMDSRVARTVVLAARAVSKVAGRPGGTRFVDIAMSTDATVLASYFASAAQQLDENNVPETERYAVLRPAQYHALVASKSPINRDWDGAGSLGKGQITMLHGIEIRKSTALPSTNVAAQTGENNTYSGDFTGTVGVIFHKAAVGTVKLLDLSVESEYSTRYQGTLIVSKYAVGSGILRPECAIELATA